MLKTVILDGVARLEGERSPSAIYHILTGKRSAQTIQDSKLFHLHQYFGVLPKLRQYSFKNQLSDLIKGNDVVVEGDDMFLTDVGRKKLADQLNRHTYLSALNGFLYHESGREFWLRLILFIQAASNILKDEHHFFPVVEDPKIIRWVKRFYADHRSELSAMFNEIYDEMKVFLQELDEYQADIIVSRFSGYHHYGKSKEQIANNKNMNTEDVELYTQSAVHFILREIDKTPSAYPWLKQFVPERRAEGLLTHSARETWKLLSQEKKSIEEIIRVRRLKKGTIQDHIVEIAFADSEFDISPFMGKDDEKQILHLLQTVPTRRLKYIKNQLPEHLSYFQIRLVMARYHHLVSRKEEMASP
ncbi:MAG: helix-turn-helix domain-containing protein [Bacillaceae bacterium]|nr:helix-turn-helix domain-containing protein [Bacillaceae bacterium]